MRLFGQEIALLSPYSKFYGGVLLFFTCVDCNARRNGLHHLNIFEFTDRENGRTETNRPQTSSIRTPNKSYESKTVKTPTEGYKVDQHINNTHFTFLEIPVKRNGLSSLLSSEIIAYELVRLSLFMVIFKTFEAPL